MNPNEDTLLPLLDQYLAGECSATEATVVRDWLAADPEMHERVMADVRRIRDVAKWRPAMWSAATAWERAMREFGLSGEREEEPQGAKSVVGVLARRVASKEERLLEGSDVPIVMGLRGRTKQHPRQLASFKAQPLPRAIWYAVATVVIGGLGAVIGWHDGIHQRFEHTLRPISTYTTTSGQRATMTLLDGTTVVLGVASRLDVPSDFSAGDHTVHLIGEALFTVTHHADVPFTVIAGATKTRVLGTSFLVRHYPNDTSTTVAVRDGKVVVDSAVVTAQHLVEVGPHRILAGRRADPSAFSFATGVLTLNITPLPDAIPELDRWFDVDIRLGDPVLAKERIMGRFTTGSVAELTHLLEMAYDVRVVRDGHVLTLFPR